LFAYDDIAERYRTCLTLAHHIELSGEVLNRLYKNVYLVTWTKAIEDMEIEILHCDYPLDARDRMVMTQIREVFAYIVDDQWQRRVREPLAHRARCDIITDITFAVFT
jgi:hypothetical protein